MHNDALLPLKDAAQTFDVKLERLRRAAWQGRLRAVRIGTQWMVRPSEIERFLRDKGRQVESAELPAWKVGPGAGRVITIAVPKGGAGRTTTALNLGAALAEVGERVLLVDFDPEASLTLSLGFDPTQLKHTVDTAIEDYQRTYQPNISAAILSTSAGIDLAPASIRLNLANANLINMLKREEVLRRLLAPIRPQYDLILIDTLPYLGILVENALVAAQEVLIPVQAPVLSTESAWLMVQQVERMRLSDVNPDLRICGLLITQYYPQVMLQRQFVEQVRHVFGREAYVFETEIEHSKTIWEAQMLQQSLFQYQPTGPAARAYRAVAQEVLHGVPA